MSLHKGDRLGPYEIIAAIGAGGMGSVYKARDTRIDRIVAVKVSKAEFSQRFEREARAVGSLNHTNICHLYDVGPNYLVMEYVEGAPIAPTDDIHTLLEQAMQIADGMAAAHALGITHRDLKPGNILVTRTGQVKILDFGLAQVDSDTEAAEPDATATMGLTDPGTAIGTVAYMSPEQARGIKVDARSDLWSLGVILYEMATRTRPFQGPTTPVVFEGILTKTPVPVREKNPKIPVDLERIIAKLLEKDRETRYQSAADVRADLKRVERDSSGAGVVTGLVSQPAVPQALETPPSKPGPWPKYAIAAGALVLIAGGVLWWQRAQARPLTDKDTLVLADFTNTTGDPVFDGTLRVALAGQLEESPFLKIMSNDSMRYGLQLMGRPPSDRVSSEVAREICVRLGEKAFLGGVIAALGKTYSISLEATNCQTGDILAREQVEAEDKEHVLKSVATAARGMRSKLGESLASVQKQDRTTGLTESTTTSLEAFQAYAKGEELYSKGQTLDSMPYFERAIELDPNFAMAYEQVAMGYGIMGVNRSRVSEYWEKAFALRDRVSENERLLISGFYYGRTDRAKAQEAFEMWAHTYPRMFLPRVQLGNEHIRAGEYEQALQDFLEAHRLEPQNGPVHVFVVRAYARLDRFAEAKTTAEEAFSRKIDFPGLRRELLNIAYIQDDRDAAEKQIQWFRGNPEEYSVFREQATHAQMLGQRRKAQEFLKRASELARGRGINDVGTAPDPVGDAVVGLCGPPRPAAPPAAAAICGDSVTLQKILDGPAGTGIGAQAAYLRGLAFLRQSKGAEAVAEFQKLLDHKGANWGYYYPAAYVGLGRAAALSGDIPKAKKAYQDFLALWKDADKDIPILVEARKEYSVLQ